MKYTMEQWPTATNCNPTVCELCGAKLEKPKAKPTLCCAALKLYNRHDTQWRIDCKCGAVYLWGMWLIGKKYEAKYIRTHKTMELLMARSEYSKELIVPKPI